MVNSADMTLDPAQTVTWQAILLSRSSAYMLLALAAMSVAGIFPIRRLAAALERETGVIPSPWLPPFSPLPPSLPPSDRPRVGFGPAALWVGIALLLGVLATVYIPGLSAPKKGANRWLDLPVPGVGNVSVQPSEIAKWGLVLLMAWYAATRASALGRFWTGLLPALIGAGMVAGFVVLEDLGTGVLLGAVACIILLGAGARLAHLLALAPPALVLLTLAVFTSSYRIHRLTAFLDPYADPDRTGFHMIQSMTAVANGEVFGRGLGHGLQKFGYLPEDRSDFLFAVICEELGIAGAACVIALYAGLLIAGLSIVRQERSPLLKLAALGIMTTVGLQAVINLAVVTGLGPTKGIALPLLSSGGTGWILTAASLGLVIAIDRSRIETAMEDSPSPVVPAIAVSA
jgi:cell division protein FtsW